SHRRQAGSEPRAVLGERAHDLVGHEDAWEPFVRGAVAVVVALIANLRGAGVHGRIAVVAIAADDARRVAARDRAIRPAVVIAVGTGAGGDARADSGLAVVAARADAGVVARAGARRMLAAG